MIIRWFQQRITIQNKSIILLVPNNMKQLHPLTEPPKTTPCPPLPKTTWPRFQEQQLPLSATPRTDCLDLEDDDDIHVLLDRAYSRTCSVRSEFAPRPATSGGKRSVKPRPDNGQPHGRSQAMAESLSTQEHPSSSRGKAIVRRPQTAGAGGPTRSLEGRKISPSGAVQLRREMLLRSHGEGSNMHMFSAEPFKTTAMGRKACVVDPGRRTEVRKVRGTTATRACILGLES